MATGSVLFTAAMLAAVPARVGAGAWTPSVTVSLKEEYDSNVFLQDVGALADRTSMVTTLIPSLGLKYAVGAPCSVQLSYAPEAVWFHEEPGENHVLHRIGLNGAGAWKDSGTEWDLQNSLLVISGEDEGLVYAEAGGAGAAGAPRVRDRRDAAIYRGGLKVTQKLGSVLLRPAVSMYQHDFQARHSSAPGYLNFVDRRDLNGGLDVGTDVTPGARAWVGYRYGIQDQARLMQFPEEYDNHYHRLLFALEGAPWKWLKAAVTLGPEFREYGDRVPASFGDRHELNLFVDASLTFTLGAKDTLVVVAKQFEQPGFGGRSVYEDLTYDLTWRHRWDGHWSTSVTGRAYNTDFTYPSVRDDWVLSASGTVAWTFGKHLQAEASITYEDGESRVPNTKARDYTREVVALGIRYTFR